MPVILDQDNYDGWLDPGMTDTAAVLEMVRPFEARRMRSYPVSSRVNQVQNDDAECCAALAFEQEPQRELFG